MDWISIWRLSYVLAVILIVGEKEEEDKLKQVAGINIVGTELGQDKDTPITTLATGQFISFRRNVNQNLRLDLDGSNAYTLIFEQDGVVKTVKVNGGGDSTIGLTQQ